jgi:hypothetical protein
VLESIEIAVKLYSGSNYDVIYRETSDVGSSEEPTSLSDSHHFSLTVNCHNAFESFARKAAALSHAGYDSWTICL